MNKLLSVIALSASIGCIADVSDEYVKQEVQGCSCGARIVKETRSTDEWLRLSEYIEAKNNSTGAAWEMVEEANTINCLEKSIYFFSKANSEYSEFRHRDIGCDGTVDEFIMVSGESETVMQREVFGNELDSGFLEMEADFESNFDIEKKIAEWHERKGF